MMKFQQHQGPGKEFTNTYLDADYLAMLAYADALATNETRGSMADMLQWVYAYSKKLISTTEIDANLACDQQIRVEAYHRWERQSRRNGRDKEDWFWANCKLDAEVWLRLSGRS